LINGQERSFKRVLAVFMSTVVYLNLLFSANFVQAGGQDKIPEVRQEIHRLLSGLLKGSCVSIKRQSGVTVPCKFLDNLPLAKEKMLNQTVQTVADVA